MAPVQSHVDGTGIVAEPRRKDGRDFQLLSGISLEGFNSFEFVIFGVTIDSRTVVLSIPRRELDLTWPPQAKTPVAVRTGPAVG